MINAGVSVISKNGLNKCSIDAVSAHTGCAKGLINYHFGTKRGLLERIAQRIRDDRHDAVLGALVPGGSMALDALWLVMTAGASSGRTRAWLALLAHPPTTPEAQPTGAQIRSLRITVAKALGVPEARIDPTLLQAGLEGIEVRLQCGVDPSEARESYDRFWLALLSHDFSGD